jgi:hypothetical protein
VKTPNSIRGEFYLVNSPKQIIKFQFEKIEKVQSSSERM